MSLQQTCFTVLHAQHPAGQHGMCNAHNDPRFLASCWASAEVASIAETEMQLASQMLHVL